jgi:hypothetical protein
MPLIPKLRKFVRSPPKALLLALPLLVAGCAHDGSYAVGYYDEPYFDSCFDCRHFFGPDFRYRHHDGYGHPGPGHFPGHGGPSGFPSGGHGSHR